MAAIRRHTDTYLDCHLMMTNPGEYLGAFAEAGANHCTVHVEVDGTEALIDAMRKLGLGTGLAINPETPFEVSNPGWPGSTCPKTDPPVPGFYRSSDP